jgi:hypothetical protein
MSLEEVEQRQQQQQVSDQQLRALSRASDKDSGAHAPASSSRILTDFLKAGRGGTPAAAAADGHAALPAGLLEAIMGGVGGGQGSTAVGETGGFNFDSIMMESVIDLSSLLGGSSQNARNGGEIMSGDVKNSIAPAQQQQQVPPQQQQQPPPEQQQQQQSRFSQFFSKPQPEPVPAAQQAGGGGSRRSSIQEELTSSAGASILRELNGGAPATIRIPSPEDEGGAGASSKYFTPISPAAKTGAPPPR